MKHYTDTAEIIIDLHEKGFINDFQLKGNDLYWLDEDKPVNVGEFSVVEFHKSISVHGHDYWYMVLGITALHYNIKGILLRRLNSQTIVLPPIIQKKLNELEAEGVQRENIISYSHQIIHE